MIEEQYSVNIYFLVVVFDINLGVTSCSLLAGGVIRSVVFLVMFMVEQQQPRVCLAMRTLVAPHLDCLNVQYISICVMINCQWGHTGSS